MSKSDICLLYQQFSGRSEHEIQDCLKKALFLLDRKMKLPQISRRYASLCISKIAAAIHNAAKMKTLDKVFLIPAYPEREPKIMLSYGDRMDDRKYQKLVERVLQTDSSEEKVALILQEVHSIADLLDILSDAELHAEELGLIINTLPSAVFVALLSQYPNDDFLESEHEQLLYGALQKRKQRLSFDDKEQGNNGKRFEQCRKWKKKT
ncbi:MAG: DUF6179 domain-containing protein [Eubacteriales bacterium]|nr:DUF6179 domain-containing protein [Eubacteriales bacterium]